MKDDERSMPEAPRIDPGEAPPDDGDGGEIDPQVLHDLRHKSPQSFVGKYDKATAVRVAQALGATTEELKGLQAFKVVEMAQALISAVEEPEEGPVEPEMKYSPAPPASDDSVLLATPGKTWAVRCPKCGEIPIVFQEGFSPRRPETKDGERIPFFRWPFRYYGPKHMSESELRYRSRERPTCTYCSRAIPLRMNGRQILPRVVHVLQDATMDRMGRVDEERPQEQEASA